MAMNLLKRELAPISNEAWEAIDAEASRVLRTALSARKFVDVAGPFGPDFTSINLGHLDLPGRTLDQGIEYGVYRVQPLMEIRIPFELNIWDLDDILRGAEDPDLQNLEDAARKAAACEDRIVFEGNTDARIVGLGQSPVHEPIPLAATEASFIKGISRAMLALQDMAVEGPYALVAGKHPWQSLTAFTDGYPLRRQVERLIEGPVIYSPVIHDAYLVSLRGGDFRLTLGQDFGLGYLGHDSEVVRLYLTESFSFQALEPAAIVTLRAA